MGSVLLRTWTDGGAGQSQATEGWRVIESSSTWGWRHELSVVGRGLGGPVASTDVSIEVDAATASIRLRRPLTAIKSLYFRPGPQGTGVSDDPRRLRKDGDTPDPRALAGVLMFGTLIAPSSPWREITQVLPGMETVIDFTGLVKESRPLAEPEFPARELSVPGPLERIKWVRETLAAVVGEICAGQEPLVLFSGGVDSSLLALAARDHGFTSTRLLHCSMGDADPETEQARRVAVALKLPFEVVTFRPAEILPNFPSLLGDYPVPFSDYSILPTWYLSREAVKRLKPGSIALDGTAADAAFGQFGAFRKWSNFYRIPLFLREAGAWFYEVLKCYRNEGKLDRWLRKPQRTGWFSPEFGNLVVHPMAGIGVHVPMPLLEELERDVLSWAAQVLPFDDEVKFCMIDIVHQCRGVLAQKDAPAFNAAGRTVGYPYLNTAMLRLAMEEVRYWPGQREPKAILKEVLAAEIGPELVYRPKSGFVLPQVETFGHPVILELVEEVLQERSGLLAAWIDRPVLSSLLEALRAKKRLALYTYSYIWAIIIAHSWYKATRSMGSQ